MFRRGAFHSGACAITVAGLLCGLNVSSLRLHAQPTPWIADQPVTGGFGTTFDERFSIGAKSEPVFTHAEIQASLPPPGDAEESSAWAGGEPSLNLEFSLAELWGPARVLDPTLTGPGETRLADADSTPQPEESTASVQVQEPADETIPPPPDEQTDLPPPDVSPPPGFPAPPSEPPSARPENQPSEDTAKKEPSPGQVNQKAQRMRAKQAARRPPEVTATSSVRGRSGDQRAAAGICPAGTSCLSQQQTFAIVFGFLAGGLLGGPIGAIAIGTAAALMTAPDEPRGTTSNTAQRR